MGLFDSLLGRTKVEKPTLERLFAMSTAQVTLDTSLDLRPSQKAAICFKPMSSSRFRESGKDIEEMVRMAFTDSGTTSYAINPITSSLQYAFANDNESASFSGISSASIIDDRWKA